VLEDRSKPARALASLASEEVEDKRCRLGRRGIEVVMAAVAATPGVAQALDPQAPRREPAADEPVGLMHHALAERPAGLGIGRRRRRSAGRAAIERDRLDDEG